LLAIYLGEKIAVIVLVWLNESITLQLHGPLKYAVDFRSQGEHREWQTRSGQM
jgi:hypothetical protein